MRSALPQAMLATSKPVSRVLPKVIRTGFARMRCGCLIRQLPYLEAARNGAVRIRHAFANLVHHPYPARPMGSARKTDTQAAKGWTVGEL